MKAAKIAVVAARLGTAAAAGAAAGVAYAAARPRPAPRERVADPPTLPPGRTVAVPGHGELFVRDAAGPVDGPVILLLHGWMVPADVMWYRAFEPLARLGRVVAPDHRGHGRGARPAEPFRLVDVADDVAALVRHLELGPVVLVGYSMGGAVAQLVWRRHPDVVRGLVLAATAATFNDTPQERWQWRAMGVLQLVLRLLPRATWERLVRAQVEGRLPVRVTRVVHSDTPPEVLALLPWFLAEIDRGSAEDVAEAGRELGRFDSRAWLGEVDVPVHVLVTTRDGLVPLARQHELARLVPGARSVDLPLDHDAVVASHDRFVPALIEAVRSVLAAGETSAA